MLAAGPHATGAQPLTERRGEIDHHRRIAMEGTIADHPGRTVIEIQHRGEGIVDAVGPQLGGQHQAGRPCQLPAGLGIGCVALPQRTHRWQAGEAIAEALHAPPLVIHRDQQRGLAQGMDLGGQGLELFGVSVVAREQDDPADQGMAQTLAVERGQFGTGDIDHQRPERQTDR